MDISIVIPAYNEENRIVATLNKIYNYLKQKQFEFEIIIVDDGSKDKTRQIVENFEKENKEIKLLQHEKNKGKGASVRTGVLIAKGDYILFSDSDLSTPIEELDKLLFWVKEKDYDIAIASRGLPDSQIPVPQPWHRRLTGKMFPIMVRLIVTNQFRDTQCGFKLFKKDASKEIFKEQKITGFAFDVEVLYKAILKRYKIKEVPVIWINSASSKVAILRDPLKMLKDLFIIKFLK
jgi:dolichyl-phosphate beta-glucosyltransferase